jgi:hypothetical protein
MRKAEVLAQRRRHQLDLQHLGAAGLYLFGSVARDEATAASDVDLLIDPATQNFNLYDLIRFQDACTRLLGAPVEVHDYDGSVRLPSFRARVEKDLTRVF